MSSSQEVEKPQVVLHKNLPQDINNDEILTRLPVRSLFRFKAVSKLWHSTISNPKFHTRCPASSIFAMTYLNIKSYGAHHELHKIDEKGGIEKIPVPCELNKGLNGVVVLSNSCHGVMLLYCAKTSDVFLVNPSAGYADVVLKLDYYCFGEPYEMGFCYDESICDYKAVIFISEQTGGFSVRVASLKEKEWKTVDVPTNIRRMNSPGHLVNDRLHAIASLSDYHDFVNNTIVRFNPINDVFENVPKSEDDDAIVGLGVLEDCLCMARRSEKNVRRGDVEVLKMKEYGVAESWTTFFVIKDFGVFVSRLQPLLMTSNGHILISIHQKIWAYNLAEKSFTKFIPTDYIKSIDIITFVENLCSRSQVLTHRWRQVHSFRSLNLAHAANDSQEEEVEKTEKE